MLHTDRRYCLMSIARYQLIFSGICQSSCQHLVLLSPFLTVSVLENKQYFYNKGVNTVMNNSYLIQYVSIIKIKLGWKGACMVSQALRNNVLTTVVA